MFVEVTVSKVSRLVIECITSYTMRLEEIIQLKIFVRFKVASCVFLDMGLVIFQLFL